ncbi:MAG TPA: CBS domain-containing protein [Isosphaeraceae bacterium]|nr:CBS domain-containing protein [Isosphaeraceae bacterium]
MQVADKVASKLTAADVMSPAPRTCSIYSSVLEAVLIFRDADCGAIPVVETGEAVGILTDRDAVRALAEHPDLATREVGDIMTRGVVAVAPGDSLASVAAKFGARGLHRLLVVDSGKMLRGIVAWSDLAPHLSDRAVDRFVSEVIRQPRESGLA